MQLSTVIPVAATSTGITLAVVNPKTFQKEKKNLNSPGASALHSHSHSDKD